MVGALELDDLKETGPSTQLQQKKHVLTYHQTSTCFKSNAAIFHLQGPDTSL